MQFKNSTNFTLGAELEIQILNKNKYDLIPLAGVILDKLKKNDLYEYIKPEVTQSMLEINSSIHDTPAQLQSNLKSIRDALLGEVSDLGIAFCGGGAHPFQSWSERKIYPLPRYKTFERKYGYLAKMFTVFGLHIHIGCDSPENALLLTQSLYRFIPQLIALSASSPFYQGEDTHFQSSRLNMVNAFPLTGPLPPMNNWEEFCQYVETMKGLNIVEGVDNFYWDVRPRAEFGTVEVCICDMPLTIEHVSTIAAYLQTLAQYILAEKPNYSDPKSNDYLARVNRFQASRHGFNGNYIDPQTHQTMTIGTDIIQTCDKIKQYAIDSNNLDYLNKIVHYATIHHNDSTLLRQLFQHGRSLDEIVKHQSSLFSGQSDDWVEPTTESTADLSFEV